ALRGAARRAGVLAAALGLALAVVRDAESPFDAAWFWAFSAAWLALFAWRAVVALRTDEREARIEIELGVLLVVAIYGALGRSDGGLSGSYYPIVYVLVAAVSAFARPVGAALVLAALVALEGAVRYAALGERS